MTVIYTVYADVSGGHDGSPVMVMGGYVARLGQWANLNRQFGLLLKKNKLTHHHTKKMYHGSGEYAGWKLTQKIRYMDKVERIIEKNTLCGFTVSMSHEDYAEHYAKDRPPAIVLDSKYGLCFRLFLTMLGNLFQRSLTGVELHLVLEDGDQGIGDSDRIFQDFKKFAPPELTELVKSQIKADKKAHYGLQIADWCAFGAYHAEQGVPDLTHYPANATLAEAAALVPDIKSPVHRWGITPVVMKDMKQRLIDHKDHRRQFAESKIVRAPA